MTMYNTILPLIALADCKSKSKFSNTAVVISCIISIIIALKRTLKTHVVLTINQNVVVWQWQHTLITMNPTAGALRRLNNQHWLLAGWKVNKELPKLRQVQPAQVHLLRRHARRRRMQTIAEKKSEWREAGINIYTEARQLWGGN